MFVWPSLWDARYRAPRAVLPGGSAGHLISSVLTLLQVGFAGPVRHRTAGALLPHHFTLTAPQYSPVIGGWGAGGIFLLHFPSGHPARPLACTLPCEARTFLSTLASTAATRPTPVRILSGTMATVNRKGGSGGIKSFVITVAFIFLFTVALLLDIQYLYLMAVMLALIQPIAYGMVALTSPKYQVKRRHQPHGVEGRPLNITLEVNSAGKFPALMLELEDTLSPALTRTSDAVSRTLDEWDGHSGSLAYTVFPTIRGVHKLGPTHLQLSDPLGLFSFNTELAEATQVVVHPSPLPIRIGLSGGEGRIGVREREGKSQRGEGMEFHGVRAYHPGDSLRRVHWPTSARTGNLAVVEFERAFEQDLVVGLDLRQGSHAGQGRESTLEYAIKIAATLVDRTLAREGGVLLVSQAGAIKVDVRERDPEAARFQLFEQLARAEARFEHSLADALKAQRLPAGARYAILSADPDPVLLGFVNDRLRAGEGIRLYYLSGETFDQQARPLPALLPTLLHVIERQHSPWEDGGKKLEQILRKND